MKASVFHNKQIPMSEEIILCKNGHSINGIVPTSSDIQYDGQVCDCGKLKFFAEKCGCPDKNRLELISKPNE